MKKLFSSILVLALVLSFIACGKNSSSSDVSKDSTDNKSVANEDGANENEEEIEIRFAWWGDTKRHEVYNEITDRFEAANPGIKVVREPGSWADYWDKLATQSAGGNAPDVFGMHPQYVSDYAMRNTLANLQTYVDNGIIDVSKIQESVVDSGKVGDDLLMISQGVTFTNLAANTTLAEKYGATLPAYNEDWTWNEYAEEAKKFADNVKAAGDSDIYFSNDLMQQYNTFRYMARQAGGDLYTVDGAIDFTEETVVEWFTFWNDLRKYGAVPDAATSSEDGGVALEQKVFTLGKSAITSIPANQLHLYQDQMVDSQLICLRNPTGNKGERGEYIEGAHFAVSNTIDDAHKEAAAKLINFFVNTEESLELFKMEQGVPANTEMGEFIKPLLDETMTIEIDFVNATMEVAGQGTYAPKGATEIDTAFKEAAATVQFEQSTPEDAAKTFMAQAQSIIDANK